MKAVALFVSIIVVLLAVPLLIGGGDAGRDLPPADGLPWQIERLTDGSTRVFGLVLGVSTLDEARQRHGQNVKVALVVAPGENGSVEAYFESITAGRVTGRMILTLVTSVSQQEQMLRRARKAEFMEGATRKVELDEADRVQLGNAAIAAITFIPAANLDEQIILQRFGSPGERIRSSEHTEHFLYPDKGLDLRLDAKGKEVLQYVSPRDFARVRDPLKRSVGPGVN